MNKLLQISMIMLLVGSLAACGTNKKEENVANNGATTTENATTTTENATETNVHTNTPTNETVTNNVNGNEGHKLELADDVADKIAGMAEVKKANVIVTNHNAYVAVELKEGTNANEALETKIADEARATNGNFKNVYVSTNPDFAKQFNEYGEKIRANEPVEGFFKEFSDTVKRVFPDAH